MPRGFQHASPGAVRSVAGATRKPPASGSRSLPCRPCPPWIEPELPAVDLADTGGCRKGRAGRGERAPDSPRLVSAPATPLVVSGPGHRLRRPGPSSRSAGFSLWQRSAGPSGPLPGCTGGCAGGCGGACIGGCARPGWLLSFPLVRPWFWCGVWSDFLFCCSWSWWWGNGRVGAVAVIGSRRGAALAIGGSRRPVAAARPGRRRAGRSGPRRRGPDPPARRIRSIDELDAQKPPEPVTAKGAS